MECYATHNSLCGEVFFYFSALYCSLLGFNGLLALLTWNYCLVELPRYKGGNNNIPLLEGNYKLFDISEGKTRFNKLWPLLDLRA